MILREAIRELRFDFHKWSGGFAPESPDTVDVYIEYALQHEIPEDVARRLLLKWMNNPDRFERQADRDVH